MGIKKFRLMMAALFIVGTLALGVIGEIYIASKVVHPDGIVTLVNPTTQQRVQSYAVGNMQIYIDQAYRMQIPIWKAYVQTIGENHGVELPELDNANADALALTRDNPDNDVNPFILRLTIKNIAEESIHINGKNFILRTVEDEFIRPDEAWMDVMAKAGFFAGTGEQTEIAPAESKTLWLVFGAPSKREVSEMAVQEYVRIFYGSDNELFATKVEFPFNYTMGYPIGDYDEITSAAKTHCAIVFLVWFGLFGFAYYRLKDDYIEENNAE